MRERSCAVHEFLLVISTVLIYFLSFTFVLGICYSLNSADYSSG